MDRNLELLNYIYQNSEMGMESSEQLMGNVTDKDLLDKLEEQRDFYKMINAEAKAKINEAGHIEKDINAMGKIMSGIKISVSAMIDSTPTHIAEMMIQGSSMGITDMTKRLSQYEDCDSWHLGRKLLAFEERSMEKWKEYLKASV